MSYNSKYKGAEVEDALDKFANGKVGNIGAVDTNDSIDEPEGTYIREKIEELLDAVEKKADEEGYYPQLSVGLADNLLGHAPSVERKIVFDATASKNNDVTDDVARIESIKGNSF